MGQGMQHLHDAQLWRGAKQHGVDWESVHIVMRRVEEAMPLQVKEWVSTKLIVN